MEGFFKPTERAFGAAKRHILCADAAMAGYDIFDANKLFGNGTVAEPYLVCNGVNLCKEEVNETSYAATMNIRSSEARSVEIAADNVPEGYSLVLKDGETETPMNQGDIYTTDIASGENAERFKLLINKNNVSLDEIAATEKPKVSSINRNITPCPRNGISGNHNPKTCKISQSTTPEIHKISQSKHPKTCKISQSERFIVSLHHG